MAPLPPPSSATSGPQSAQPIAGHHNRTNSLSQISLAPDHIYSLDINDYNIGQVIGYGSSAIVHAATYIPLDKEVAVKMIELDRFESNQIEELRKEIQVMSLSKHPAILPPLSSFVNGSKLYIITPFLSHGSLLDIMKTSHPQGLEENLIAAIMKQTLSALEYLHKNNHIHRDVKAGNLLIDKDGTVFLADFGVSSSLNGDTRGKDVRKTFVGTPCWMAPEVMEQVGYDQKADIWSFGITALELANGRAPLAAFPPMKVLLMTLQNDPPTLDRNKGKHKYSRAFKEMIDLCLQKDPSKRASAEKLLQHAFFKNAKKKQFLADSFVKNLAPVSERPHKAPRQFDPAELQMHQSWDFSEQPDASTNKEEQTSEKSEPPNSDVMSEQSYTLSDKPKRKFVVTNDKTSLESAVSNAIASVNAPNHSMISPIPVPSGPQPIIVPKEGVEQRSASIPPSSSFETNTSPVTKRHSLQSSSDSIPPEVRKGRFSVIESAASAAAAAAMAAVTQAVNTLVIEAPDMLNDGKEKRGRFEVTQDALRPVTGSMPATSISSSSQHPGGPYRSSAPIFSNHEHSSSNNLERLLKINDESRATLLDLMHTTGDTDATSRSSSVHDRRPSEPSSGSLTALGGPGGITDLLEDSPHRHLLHWMSRITKGMKDLILENEALRVENHRLRSLTSPNSGTTGGKAP